MQLVLDPAERKTVLEAADVVRGQNRLPQDAVDEPERVIVLKAAPEPGYVLMYAAPAGRNNVGVWLFAADKFRAIYPFEDKIAPSEQFLRRFVSDLADRQKEFLTAGR